MIEAISSSTSSARRVRRVVGAVETRPQRPLSRPVRAVAWPQGEEVSLGQRLRDWKTLVGFGISAAIVVFFVLTAHLDLGVIWANIRSADVRYLAFATSVYFGAFLFRGLRWRLLLRRADLGEGVHLPPLRGLVE